MDDHALLRELAPVAGRMFERHLAASWEWLPFELVPWERTHEPPLPIDSGVRSALVVNVLTEDALPYYTTASTLRFGGEGPWWDWTRRWTAEEMRHGLALHDYLSSPAPSTWPSWSGAACATSSTAVVPTAPSVPDGFVYLALQELATRIAHANTARLPARRRRPAPRRPGGGRRAPAPPLLPRRRRGRAGGVAVGHGGGDRPAGASLRDARSRPAGVRRPRPGDRRRRHLLDAPSWSTSSSRWCSARGAWTELGGRRPGRARPATGRWPSSSGSAGSRPGSTALPPRRRPAAEHHAVVRDRAEAELDVGGHQVAPEPPHRLLTDERRRPRLRGRAGCGPRASWCGRSRPPRIRAPRPRTTARSRARPPTGAGRSTPGTRRAPRRRAARARAASSVSGASSWPMVSRPSRPPGTSQSQQRAKKRAVGGDPLGPSRAVGGEVLEGAEATRWRRRARPARGPPSVRAGARRPAVMGGEVLAAGARSASGRPPARRRGGRRGGAACSPTRSRRRAPGACRRAPVQSTKASILASRASLERPPLGPSVPAPGRVHQRRAEPQPVEVVGDVVVVANRLGRRARRRQSLDGSRSLGRTGTAQRFGDGRFSRITR